MPTQLLRAAAALGEALADFDPRSVLPAECGPIATALARVENACCVVKALVAARALEMGDADAAGRLACHSGTTRGRARRAMEVANRLSEHPAVMEAVRSGEVSLAVAEEITATADDVPEVAAELLDLARSADLTHVRDRARECREARDDPEEVHRRQVAARSFRHWRERDGMIRFAGALPPESGLSLVRRVDAGASARRREAKLAGRELERFEAYAADAFVDLIGGRPGAADRAGKPAAELVIVCDLFAWRRGTARPGEVCRIIGGSPIPVGLAKELAEDAFIKAVLHDGVDIHTIRHFGRHLPAPLRTALDLGPVPEFTGRACVECGSTWGLEYDHVNPVANRGLTEYANLLPRCWTHHQAKTERDRKAGLLGPNARSRPPPAVRSG